MKNIIKIILKKPLLIITILWLSHNTFSFLQYGVESDYEATKYIEQASHLITTGKYTSPNFIFYSVQIFLIATSIKLKIGYWFVILIQLLLNAISTYLLFELIRNKTENLLLASIGTIFFLFMHYYHLYNFYLFTESIFFSLSIVFTYFLFSLRQLNVKNGIGIFFFLLLIYLTRPIGIFFLPATLAYLIIKFYSKNLKRIIFTSVLFSVIFYILLNKSLSSGGELDFLLPYTNEMIICGISTIETNKSLHIPVSKNSIQGLFYIISRYPELFFNLSTKRLIAFFGLTRSYYSTAHNIFIAFYFYGMYIIILVSVIKILKRYKPEVIFLLSIIFFVTITVMLSCDEWHNRFIMGLLPFFIILTAFSLAPLNNSDE